MRLFFTLYNATDRRLLPPDAWKEVWVFFFRGFLFFFFSFLWKGSLGAPRGELLTHSRAAPSRGQVGARGGQAAVLRPGAELGFPRGLKKASPLRALGTFLFV